jgi:hypothetical protein
LRLIDRHCIAILYALAVTFQFPSGYLGSAWPA